MHRYVIYWIYSIDDSSSWSEAPTWQLNSLFSYHDFQQPFHLESMCIRFRCNLRKQQLSEETSTGRSFPGRFYSSRFVRARFRLKNWRKSFRITLLLTSIRMRALSFSNAVLVIRGRFITKDLTWPAQHFGILYSCYGIDIQQKFENRMTTLFWSILFSFRRKKREKTSITSASAILHSNDEIDYQFLDLVWRQAQSN